MFSMTSSRFHPPIIDSLDPIAKSATVAANPFLPLPTSRDLCDPARAARRQLAVFDVTHGVDKQKRQRTCAGQGNWWPNYFEKRRPNPSAVKRHPLTATNPRYAASEHLRPLAPSPAGIRHMLPSGLHARSLCHVLVSQCYLYIGQKRAQTTRVML